MNAATITVQTSHLAMLAAPERVADSVRLAAEKVEEK
jgi:hypothetical protein